MALKLNRREQIALACGLAALAVVLILLVYIPTGPRKAYEEAQDNLQDLHRTLDMRQMLLADAKREQQSQERLLKLLSARSSSFDLFTFVNRLIGETDLQGRAELENYNTRDRSDNQPMVQLTLRGVSLQELVDFLHKVYASENLVASYRLEYLRPAKDNRGLDCRVVFLTIKA